MACAVLLLVLSAAPALATRADLARARSLYNLRQFDAAIEAATSARRTPETADAAAVVLARAYLERYRERADPADLGAARGALGAARVAGLDRRDRIDVLLALGEALFFEDDFGAAARVFESGLDAAIEEGTDQSEAMFDWWGSAVARQAESLGRVERAAAFERLADRMAREVARQPAGGAASYWLAAALRGSGDARGAWDAAVAGWVRARLAGERAAILRADLDKLVVEGVIPDRARALPADRRAQEEADLRAEWLLVKERWK